MQHKVHHICYCAPILFSSIPWLYDQTSARSCTWPFIWCCQESLHNSDISHIEVHNDNVSSIKVQAIEWRLSTFFAGMKYFGSSTGIPGYPCVPFIRGDCFSGGVMFDHLFNYEIYCNLYKCLYYCWYNIHILFFSMLCNV